MTFEEYFATVRFPSDSARYFMKPLLRDAFNAGGANRPRKVKPNPGQVAAESE